MVKVKALLFNLIFLFFLIPIKVYSQVKICGYVVNMDDSTAIESATIYLYDQYNLALSADIRTTTDSSGYYELRNIKPGKYNVNTWTYVYFQKDTLAYIFQPGIFNVDPDSSAFKTPCFYVNFYFKLEVSDSLFERSIEQYKQSFENHRKRMLTENNSHNFPAPDWSIIDWPSMILRYLIYSRVETIEPLFTPAYSSYTRRKDW